MSAALPRRKPLSICHERIIIANISAQLRMLVLLPHSIVVKPCLGIACIRGRRRADTGLRYVDALDARGGERGLKGRRSPDGNQAAPAINNHCRLMRRLSPLAKVSRRVLGALTQIAGGRRGRLADFQAAYIMHHHSFRLWPTVL